MTTYPNQSEPVEGEVKAYVWVLFMNSLMCDWPAARYVTGTLKFRMFERRTQRGILYQILQGNITHYSTINWNLCGRPKIALIDAEPHGKRIPRHSLRVPSFLQTTTHLQGSVHFPTSAYTDDDRYGQYVTLM